MCGLCRIIGGGKHWTDGIAHDDGGVADWQWIRERNRRIAFAGAILAPYRIGLTDWAASKYVLRGPTGGFMLADTIADLWQKAEALAGRPIDALAPELLEALDDD